MSNATPVHIDSADQKNAPLVRVKDILVIHHSHTDLGYTHPEPVLWELHRRFIDDAIDLCESTADWPESSRPCWTCEVTAVVMDWLERAPQRQIDRLKALITDERIAIGALPYNITPQLNAAQLARALKPVGILREQLGAPIGVAINHDVNGQAWPLIDLLSDIGVNHLFVGINNHFGGHALERQQVFNWRSPTGRQIRVLNGEHYHSFDRWFSPKSGSTKRMAEGWNKYHDILASRSYPHDFVITSATHFDFPDNNPPCMQTAEMIRRWNEEGREPKIQFVTPEQAAQRIQTIPDEMIESYTADWPDYWNFGCASTARETRINQQSKARLRTAEWLEVLAPHHDESVGVMTKKAFDNILLYDEHTWGSWASVWNRHADDVPAGINHKLNYAYEGRAWTGWVIREAFDNFLGNPAQRQGAEGIAIVNPGAAERTVMLDLPARLLDRDWQHYSGRIQNLEVIPPNFEDGDTRPAGPFTIKGYSTKFVPLDELVTAHTSSQCCSAEDSVIESPGYRLGFDRTRGVITSVYDKKMGKDLIDLHNPYAPFSYVHESVDPDRHQGHPRYAGRDAFFNTDFESMQVGLASGWISDWPARRQSPGKPDEVEAHLTPNGVELIIRWDRVAGGKNLAIKYGLPARDHVIEIELSIDKDHLPEAESTYLSIPLAINDWRCHYDASGRPAEFGAEQLPGTVQDYLTAGRWVAVHNESWCAVLACPDAPMHQVGGFNFGKEQKQVGRDDNCHLLAWPMNNYWDTNFPATQPGHQVFRYSFTSTSTYDPLAVSLFGDSRAAPIEWHPVVTAPNWHEQPLIAVDQSAVLIQSLRLLQPGEIFLQIQNPADEDVKTAVTLPMLQIESAEQVNSVGLTLGPVEVSGNAIITQLPPRAMQLIRLKYSL